VEQLCPEIVAMGDLPHPYCLKQAALVDLREIDVFFSPTTKKPSLIKSPISIMMG
jgi:hypothetical protein